MAIEARLALRHGRGATRLLVGRGDAWWAEALAPWLAGRRAFVVTSEPVERLHGDRLGSALGGAEAVEVLRVPDGEAAKAPAVAAELWREMSGRGGRRDSRVVAFGGGSVGDVAGFAAACFLRGVELALLPTTALAQVDAAVGGKTAVNLPRAKNAVGAFWHPHAVLSDVELLATLERRELAGGLVEVAKMAALLEPALLSGLVRDCDALLAGEPEVWAPVVAAAQRVKADVVERDAEEAGLRRVLNLGHTLGHALEAAAGHGALRHGDAVAYGLRFAYRLARRLGLEPDAETAERLGELIERLELPPLPRLEVEALLAPLGRDKKSGPEGVRWVLPRGEGWTLQAVEPRGLAEELDRFLADGGRGW